MARRILRIVRGVLRTVLVVVLGIVGLVALVYAGLTLTPAGRGLVRDVALEQANELFRGQLAAREISQLGVTGIALHGAQVTDPSGARVIDAETIELSLSPLSLLSGEIHVDRVAVIDARIDLADFGERRGVIAAFAPREPSPPEEPETASEPPVVVVDSIELDAIAASAELPEYGVVGVEALSARARFELRGVASADLESLTTKLVRDRAEAGELESVRARWVQEGEESTLALRGRIAATQLSVDARSRMPNDRDFATQPMSAHVVLDSVDADALRALGQGELAAKLKQKVRVELKASGTLDALDADVALGTAAGDVAVHAQLTARDRLDVRVASKGLTPGAVWADAPAERVEIDLHGQTRLANAPSRMPFDLDLKSASFGGSPLPVVRAKGRVEGEAVRELSVHAQGHGVTLEATGDVSADKLNVHATLRARQFAMAGASAAALDADITAVGSPLAPRASIALRGTTLKYEQFLVDELALDATGGPDIYDVKLNARAPDGKVQLATRVSLEEKAVRIDGRARGELRKRPLELAVRNARIGYGGAIEIGHAALKGLGQSAIVEGRYGTGASDRLELDARLDLVPLSDALKLEPLLRGRARVKLIARGTIERPLAELEVRAEKVSVRDPARERPAIDAQIGAALDTTKGELTAAIEIESGGELELRSDVAARFNARKAPWHEELLRAEVEGSLAINALTTAWLEQWLLEPLPLKGRLFAGATFAGTVERPELTLTTRAQLEHRSRDAGYEVATKASYAAAAVQLEVAVRDDDGAWLDLAAALERPAATLEQFLAKGAALAHEAQWRVSLKVAPRMLGKTPIDALTGKPLEPDLATISAGLDLTAEHAPQTEPVVSMTLRAVKPPRGSDTQRIGLEDYQCADPKLELSVESELANGRADVRASLTREGHALLEASAGAKVELAPALRGQGTPAVSDAGAIVTLAEIDLTSLPGLCGLAQGTLSGRVDAEALLADDPKLRVQLKGRDISMGSPEGLSLDLLASATASEAKVEVEIGHRKTRSTFDGRVPIRWQRSALSLVKDQPMQAKLALDRLPVTALLPPSFAISRASGYVSGAVRADGTLDDPKVGGRLEPQRIALTITGLAQPLHGIDGRIAFSNKRILIEQLVARDRDGSVKLSGSAELDDNNDVNAKLSIRADEFPLRQQGQIAGEIDADIDVTARMTEAKTRVDIVMKDASAWLLGGTPRKGISLDEHPDVIDPREEERKREEEVEEEEKIPPRPIEISINAEDSFWVRRDDFAVKLSTKLALEIEDEKVAATGPIQIHRGYLQMFGQTFDIDGKSKVDLVGGSPPDPVLDITASTINRGSNKKITVHIGGRASGPVLEFFVDDEQVSIGEAAQEIFGGRGGGSDDAGAEGEAKSFVAGMMAGVMAMSARRELGDAMPILMIEPGDDTSASRVRAGFELDKLVPGFLEGVIRGVYLEGIVAGSSDNEGGGGESESSSGGVQGGVLLELYLPHDLVTSGQYGPGETWSVDLGWEP
jgi:autotransporter translocation and assembly factor TamB